jgi:hypothetical protein
MCNIHAEADYSDLTLRFYKHHTRDIKLLRQ